MVAYVIAALLTTMFVEFNVPVSRIVIERGIFRSLMTSSGHAYLQCHNSFISGVRWTSLKIFGVRSVYGVYWPGEWLWIDSNGKMATTHPV